MKKSNVVVTILMLALAVSACNTIEGVGQDIQSGGKSLERAADKSK